MPRSKTPKARKPDQIKEASTVYTLPSLTKVTRHGQITLPSDLRRAIGIEEGDLIEVRVRDDQMV